MSLKRLVNRWRLVQPAGDRFKIVYRKCPGIMKTIPTDEVKRVRSVDVRIDQSLFFDQDLEIAFFIVRFQIGRPLNVALAIGRLFR
jgi:hypothetical protein